MGSESGRTTAGTALYLAAVRSLELPVTANSFVVPSDVSQVLRPCLLLGLYKPQARASVRELDAVSACTFSCFVC